MNGRFKLSCVCAAVIVCMPMLNAKVVGSTTAVSLEPATFFPANETDNLIQGFAWLKNGFTLEDELTTCTFNGLYPVSGDISFNGGTLYLLQDLIGKNSMRIVNLGTIVGNTYAIDLVSTVSYAPAGPCVLEDVLLSLHNDMWIDSTVTIKGTCILECTNHVLHIGDLGSITIASGAHLIVRHAEIQGISGTQIACADDTASLELSEVMLEQDDNFTFSHGSILFKNTVDINGSYTFTYDSNCTSTVDAYSTIHIIDGTRLKIGRKKAIDYVEPFAFVDGTSRLILDNCDFEVTATGVCFTKGEVIFQRNVNCYIASNDKEHGVVLGDGNAEHDISFYFSPGCEVIMQTGALTYKNGEANCLKSSAKNARLCRTSQSYVYFETNCLIRGITIELLDDATPPMVFAPGVNLSYDDAGVVAEGVSFDITAKQVGEYAYCLCGNQLLSLNKGLLPAYISIDGPNNIIEGTGSIWGPITMQDADAQLIWRGEGYIINDLNMNGGSIALQNKMHFCADGAFTGPGTINLGQSSLVLCEKESRLVPPVNFIGQTGKVEFNEKLILSDICTFQGSCIVDGHGGVLDLGDSAGLVIAGSSTLKLRDMTIWGVNEKKIRCLTDSGRLELNNVRFVQDGNYTFDTGSMLFTNNVTFSGGYVFSYESKLTSTIDSYATLKFDQGTTCSMSRSQLDDSVGPIVFQDSSSAFAFDNSTAFIHTNGAKFTKGTVYCYRDVTMDVISTSSVNGLIMGDGTPEGDMIFQFMPGSAVIYPRGHIVYDVTRADGLRSNSNTARIVRYDESTFYLRNNCTVKDLTVQTSPYALFITEGDAVLSYDNGAIAYSQGALEMTGQRYSTYANMLNGNNSLLLTKGYLPLYTLVDGANNTLYGNGDVLGGVTLLGTGASLIWSMNGIMLNDIQLNGGQLTMTTNLFFTEDHFVTGPGTVHMNGKQIVAGQAGIQASTPLYWDGDIATACIEMREDIALSAAWTFSGKICLNGNGCVLELKEDGELLVEDGSELILENVTVKNISGNAIRCLGDAGLITLNNSTFIQSDDFIFERGAFEVVGKALLRGFGAMFAYRSSMPSSVEANARLILDQGLTFSYDPIVPANNLIQFADDSAQLILRGATIHSTCTTGWQLTKGYLNIEKDSYVSSDVIMQDEELIDAGITVGDGSANNDMYCELASGVELYLLKGSLNYKNAVLDSWYMHDFSAKLLLDTGTTLRLYENIDLGSGYISFGDDTTLAYVADKSITGATGQMGTFNTTIISPE